MSQQPVRLFSGPEARCPPGESGAWEGAYQAHFLDLCKYVRRLIGSAEDAEDAETSEDLYLRHELDNTLRRAIANLTVVVRPSSSAGAISWATTRSPRAGRLRHTH